MKTTVESDEKGKGWRDHCLPPTICAVLGLQKASPYEEGIRVRLDLGKSPAEETNRDGHESPMWHVYSCRYRVRESA
jgi:hypothetical protein